MKALAILMAMLVIAPALFGQEMTMTPRVPAESPWLARTAINISPIAIDREGRVDVPFTMLLTTFDGVWLTDFALTKRGLALGAVEANPLMRPLFERPPLDVMVRVGMMALENYLLKVIWRENRILGWVFAIALTSFQSWATYHDYRIVMSF